MPLKVCPRCGARYRGDIATCAIDGTALVEPDDPFIGRVIAGRYRIEQALGSGGMGSVYRARHQIIGRDVALKLLEPGLVRSERQRKRFLGEARAANQIDHEHIIDITDFGETEDGVVYMVMEYLEGRTLSEEIEKGPLAPRRALRIASQIALGLARAHELGVVHRDIKPSNIYLIHRHSEPDFVKLLDFGVARIEQDMRITAQGTIVGTPEYIAPEQIHSAGALPSADLYSLGCVLFEMLTGRLPFEGKTTALLVKHLNDPPPAPTSVLASLPPAVDPLVLRLLQKQPDQRYRDAHHLVEALQQLLDALPALPRARGEGAPAPPGAADGSAHGPSLEESLYRTVSLFRSLFDEAYAHAKPPGWLRPALEYLERTADEIRSLRVRLREAAEKATKQEESSRGPRDRIGRALDELAKDDSRLGREIDALAESLRAAEGRFDTLMKSTGALAAEPLPLRPGRALSQQEILHLGKLVEGTRRLASERERTEQLRAELDARTNAHRDLKSQMTQLKEQFQAFQGAVTMDQQLAHDDVTRLTAQIQAKLDALAPHQNGVAEHFSWFPELRARHTGRTSPRSD